MKVKAARFNLAKSRAFFIEASTLFAHQPGHPPRPKLPDFEVILLFAESFRVLLPLAVVADLQLSSHRCEESGGLSWRCQNDQTEELASCDNVGRLG